MSEEEGSSGLLSTAPELDVCGAFFELSPRNFGDWVSWTGMG